MSAVWPINIEEIKEVEDMFVPQMAAVTQLLEMWSLLLSATTILRDTLRCILLEIAVCQSEIEVELDVL